ncbi:signal peptidase I [bacterium]|nr:signal peptidase I [bacterium]
MQKLLGFISILLGLAAIIWMSPVFSIAAILLAILTINMSRYRGYKFKFSQGNPSARKGFVLGCIALVLSIVYLLVFKSVIVTGESGMENLLIRGDKVLVLRKGFGDEGPRYNDLVTFRLPLNPKKILISRCVAMEYDTVRIIDKDVYVNGRPYPNLSSIKFTDFQSLPSIVSNRDNFGPYEVPKDSYFFLSDNRDEAQRDSRNIGAVKAMYLIGKPVYVLYNQGPPRKFSIKRLFSIFSRYDFSRSGKI